MINHHPTCNAAYPEKPSGEPPRHVTYMPMSTTVVATCGDCGAFERYPRTKFSDIRKPECEQREYESYTVYSRIGRTQLHITCPFCDRPVTAYLWSISGGGKRCDCGAILGGRGIGYKLNHDKATS